MFASPVDGSKPTVSVYTHVVPTLVGLLRVMPLQSMTAEGVIGLMPQSSTVTVTVSPHCRTAEVALMQYLGSGAGWQAEG